MHRDVGQSLQFPGLFWLLIYRRHQPATVDGEDHRDDVGSIRSDCGETRHPFVTESPQCLHRIHPPYLRAVCHDQGLDTTTIAAGLTARRAALLADLDRFTAPPEPGATVGFGKRIGDGTTEAVERVTTTAMARSVTKSLADIDRALAKIADGTYGVCDSCGEAIPADRLEAMPATAQCIRCKTRR